MSQPSVSEVQVVDPVLTNILVGYKNSDSRYVASRVFPSVSIGTQTATYYIMTKKYWFLDQMERRAPGSAYPRTGFSLSSATTTAQMWGLEHPIPDEVAANNQVPMGLEQAGTSFLANQSMLRKERAWAADFMTTSVWATDGSASAGKWSLDTSNPVADVQTAVRTISQSAAVDANTMVIGEIVRDRLVNHPDVISRLQYVKEASISAVNSALSTIFGINILVARAIYNTANEGQDASMSPIIDDDALILYVAPSPGIFTPSAGYTFSWAGGGGDGQMYRYYENQTDSKVIKVKEAWDQKAVCTDCGYFYADIVD